MTAVASSGQRPDRVPRTLKADDTVSSEVMKQVKAPHRPALVVLSGAEADVGRRVVVDGYIVIGRDPSARLCLADARVSWHHARIEDRGDGWAVVDQGSTNGVVIHGERVEQSALEPGDTFVIGATVLRFELQDGAAQAFNAVVERLLSVDDLSGLYVRRRFDAELAALIEAGRQASTPVSLLVMDLDGVKRINDTHGHLFGAYVIGEAGRLIGTLLSHGQGNIGCRFGGDEYLAALPGTERDGAIEVAERIRVAVGQHPFEHEGVRLHPGISIGVATFPDDAQDALGLFQRADAALYRAKEAGKNRVAT